MVRMLKRLTERLGEVAWLAKAVPKEDAAQRKARADELRGARAMARRAQQLHDWLAAGPSRAHSYTKSYIPRAKRRRLRKLQRLARRASR